MKDPFDPARGIPGKEQDDKDQKGRRQKRNSGQDNEIDPQGRSAEPVALERTGLEEGRGDLLAARPGDRRRDHRGTDRFFQNFRLLPKAELHLHMEGSISEATLRRLAVRNGSTVFPHAGAIRERLLFSGARGFLELYRDVCREIRFPSDYGLIARDITRRLSREGIGYAEIYVSPAVIEKIGLGWEPVRDQLEAVFSSFERRTGSRIRVLLDSVRQWGPAAAERVLDLQEKAPWTRVLGFGLGGDEASLPARDFSAVYDRVRALGLLPLVHAGEWAGPDSVVDAVEILGVVRIAHGVRIAEDPSLVRWLERKQVPLDICITSNWKTGAVPRGGHPALDLLRSGLRLNLSTDDPGLFRTSLRREYLTLARLGATALDLRRLLFLSRACALGRLTGRRGLAHRSRGTSRSRRPR